MPLGLRVSPAWIGRPFSSATSTPGGSKSAFSAKQPILWSEEFQEVPKQERTKAAFLKKIELFRKSRGKRGGGHVEFIEAAKRNLRAYNLHKDLDIYKALLDVFPKKEMIPTTLVQHGFWHFPQQQACAIELLEDLEWNEVKPDKELHDLMVSIFGPWNFSTRKVKRELYWLPKLWHTNKYLDRRIVEDKKLADVELAKIALKMICRDAGTQITSFKAYYTEETEFEHNNWIVSAQSPLQRRLISCLPNNCTCHVDGPFRVWVRGHMLHYVVLSSAAAVERDEEFLELISSSHYVASPEEQHQKLWGNWSNFRSNLHQQSDQTILALGILGVNSNDFASAWLNHLQEDNARISRLSVLLRLKELRRSLDRHRRDGDYDNEREAGEEHGGLGL